MPLSEVSASRDYDERTPLAERCRFIPQRTRQKVRIGSRSGADPAHLNERLITAIEDLDGLISPRVRIKFLSHRRRGGRTKGEAPRPFEAIEKLIEKS